MRLVAPAPIVAVFFATSVFAAPPMATTTAASSVTPTSAQLNGSINPGGESTTGWFRLDTTNPGACNDSFGTRVPATGGTLVGSGTTATSFSLTTTGLLPGNTYFFCAIAQNASGTALGAILSFTTPALTPTVSTTTATSVTSSSAILNGTANPNGAAATGFFRYASTNPGSCTASFGTRVPASGGTPLGSGNSSVAYTETITGLQPGMTYWYCAQATNSAGTGLGNLLTFTALVTAPTVTTNAATSITGTSAQLNGASNPNGSATTGWFRISASNPGACNDAFGTRVPTSGGSALGSGTSSSNFSQSATGLTPGTTYYYCAIAQNAEGTTLGAVQTFNTPAAPTVTTEAESNLTATTATLNATVNANGSAATAWFRYSTTNPGTCNDTFGTRAPTSGGQTIAAGAGPQPTAQAITGLLPGTMYYVCAIASNGVGTSFGSVLSFVTPAFSPSMTTSPATLVTATTATLNGSGNPRGAATTGWFRYSTTNPNTCNDTFGTRAPASGGFNLGSGNTVTAYEQAITGLTPGTTYFVCAIGQNSAGTGFGAVQQFTTPNVPTVTTTPATGIGGNFATLNGSANPNLATTTGYFRYATTNPGTCNDSFGTRFPTTGGVNLGAGATSVNFTQQPTSLLPGTTYYYCAIATNAVGTGFGAVQSFTTPAAPTVTTLAPSPLNPTGATLQGTVHPNGSATTAWFRYSTVNPTTCNDTFGTRVPSSGGASIGAGAGTTPVSQASGALVPGTLYYACLIASNAVDTSFGNVITFTTPPTAPLVTTNVASAITGTTATLNGSANPRGDAAVGFFRFGLTSPGTCSDAFGTRVPATGGTSLGSGNSNVAFSEVLAGLTPGTTYFYCAGATNGVGTTYGTVGSFSTPDVPVVTTVSATSVTGTTVTLNGTVNPNNATATSYFRYATTNPGTCNDAFGTRAPATGGTSLGGASAQAYAQSLTGLTPGTTYFYCAIANNLVGTGFGAVLSFTTPASPTITTQAATAVSTTSATLNGTVVPNGATTNTWFRYGLTNPGACNNSFGTATSSIGRGAGTAPVNFSQSVTGLLPGTTYFYCAIAQNSVDMTFGAVLSFTTSPQAPTVTTNTATPVTSNSATLRGVVNPGGAATTGWFRYATTNPGTCNDSFGFRVPFMGGTAVGSGTSNVNFTEALTGLSLATTYFYCAIAQNSEGTSFGAVQSFTTLPEVPTVVTEAATSITTTQATLNAQATPNGAATTAWFRFSTTNPGTCNDTFGTRLPSTGGTALGSGTTAVPFSVTPMTLTVGATYYYCAIAQNSAGTGFGAVLTFKTTSTAPTLNTLAATSVGGTTAQLNGSVTPNGETTTGWFRYSTTNPGTCNDTFGTRAPASGGTNVGAGTTAQSYSEVLTGLTPGATYYFCALASNSVGTVTGLVLSFTTPQSPTVTTQAATPVTANTATLNASAVPNGTAATGWFRYDTTNPGTCNDTFGTRTPASGGTSLGSGGSPIAYSQPIAGLLPGTQYFFCALASNAVGLGVGSVLSFTTPPAAPAVAAQPLTDLLATTATFNATANPNGAATTGWFRFATTNPGTCNDAFGTRFPATGGSALGSGTSVVPYSQAVTGLMSGTTYFWCPIAQNSVGTSFGGVQSFTTPGAPIVTTSAASAVAATTVQLNGSANPNRADATGFFRFGTTNPGTCSDSFGTRWPATGGVSLGNGTSSVAFNQAVTGLMQGTTYYFCAGATNAVATTFGNVLSFTTTNPPTATTLAATTVTSTSATFNGSTNPNGAATTAYFRYGTVDPGTCSDSFGTRAPATGGTALGSGTTPVAHAFTVSTLLSGTTYYFCAAGTNAVGTGFGAVLSFTTPGAPTVTTQPATMVGTTAATLNGSASPNGFATTGYFRFATTNPGSCNDTFGTRTPSTGGTALGSGNTPVDYSAPLSGLAQGTTYFYCAIASNSSGTRFGAVQSFTTQSAPVVTTSAASGVTSTTATLNGSANPRGSSATGYFRYATTSPGTCNDTFGTRVPATGGTSLGSGTAAVPFTEALTGLTPGTTYFVCAIASNANGTGFGTVSSFTTSAQPTVTTNAASAVLATTATLNGSANPNREATTGYFRYATTNPGTCNDSFGTRAPASGGTSLGSGSAAVAFTQALTGLTQSTTYFYCAIAQNPVGTSFGAVQSFTTGAGPLVTTVAADTITATGARLNGSTNPNGIATTAWFRYASTNPGACNDTFGIRTPTTGGTALGSGTAPVSHTATLTGLVSGTSYWFCAIASNAAGTAVGELLSFTTPGAPVVTTEPATAITASGATLNGTANPAGATTTGWFRYSTTNPGACNDTFGTRFPASGGSALGAGFTAEPYAQTLTGLPAATTYFYCAIASNSQGTRFGTVQSFTTAAGPAVSTSPASAVTSTTATLNGSANPRGLAATGWFRYATTNPGACNDTFGTRAPSTGGTTLGSGSTAVAYTESITGLIAGTTYFYCAIAQNSAGTSFGTVETFTTPGPPSVTTQAASAVTAAGATLNGTGTANLAAATGWFRYATVDPGTCDDSFGTRAPATGGTSLGSGTTATAFSQAVTGLASGSTYFFCAIASNSNGTRFGAVQSFTTPAAPVVTTLAATAIGSGGATLNGNANPRAAATTGWFRYSLTNPGSCNDTFGTRAPTTGGTALGSGTTPATYSQALTGLTPGATYYFCAIAQNSVGTAFGTVQSFTAATVAPIVTTQAASAVTGTSVTLNGTANPGGAATTGYFRYSPTSPGSCNDTFGTRAPSTGGTALGSGTAQTAFSQAVTGLSPGTTYYFCAIAQNPSGTDFGLVLSFDTPAQPLVTTTPASNVTGTGATLNGSAIPGGAATTGYFRYGTTNPGTCNDTFGTRSPGTGGTALGAGATSTAFAQNVFGLTPGTTYFYCALATNLVGTGFGAVQSFRTPAAPIVMTSSATVSGTMATLAGGANPNGAAATGYFRFGTTNPGTCSDTFGTRLPTTGGVSLGSGTSNVPFTQGAAGLALGQTYYFCAAATNLAGTGFGAVQSFTVAAPVPTVTTSPAADIGTRDATLVAQVNPNGTPTVAWFRYDTTAPNGCDDGFGTRVPETGGLPVGSGLGSLPVSLSATGLKPGTEYFVCAMASNTGGAAFGQLEVFTTGTEAPTVRTEQALLDDSGGAVVLRGVADTKLLTGRGSFALFDVPPLTCNPGVARLQLPLNGVPLAALDGEQPYASTATGLTPGTWYACASVVTSGGQAFGNLISFVVPAGTGCGCGAATGGLVPLALAMWLLRRRRLLRR